MPYFCYHIGPSLHDHGWRMSGEDDLHVRIQIADNGNKPLLPFYMKRYFRFVHKEHVMVVILYQNGQENDQHLLFAGRELVRVKGITILREEDFVTVANNQIGRAHV